MKKIAIIGMGYVGLPLALRFAEAGTQVTGLDVDESKIEKLIDGESYIKHIQGERVAKWVKKGRFLPTTDFSHVETLDAVIICVPTPLGKNRDPDISYVLSTGASIAPYIRKGMLISLESTTYPGTTEDDLRKILEKGSGLVAGSDFHLAFSPEREDPGNSSSLVEKIPKVVGGFTQECLVKAMEIYSIAIEKLVPVSSCRVAEATKLMENIFRSVNIALVNELKIVYERMGIDVWEVIGAAKTKPFGFMPFYPGPGLGGHCIPIDPFYLTWKAHQYGICTRFIELAGEINTAMPEYVIGKVVEALNNNGKAVNGSKILLLGIAYKAGVDDDRESPSYILYERLQKLGAEVSYFDPHVPIIRPSREHSHLAGIKSINWNPDVLREFDLALICTAHSEVDYQVLGEFCRTIVDTRNAMQNIDCNAQIYKA